MNKLKFMLYAHRAIINAPTSIEMRTTMFDIETTLKELYEAEILDPSEYSRMLNSITDTYHRSLRRILKITEREEKK